MSRSLITITILVAIMIALTGVVAHAFSREDFYKSKYKEKMVPALEHDLVPKLKEKGKSNEEITAIIVRVAEQMATCQIKSIRDYNQSYLDAVFEVVASGGSIDASNDKFDKLLREEVSSGRISKEAMAEQIQKSAAFVRTCLTNAYKSAL